MFCCFRPSRAARDEIGVKYTAAGGAAEQYKGSKSSSGAAAVGGPQLKQQPRPPRPGVQRRQQQHQQHQQHQQQEEQQQRLQQLLHQQPEQEEQQHQQHQQQHKQDQQHQQQQHQPEEPQLHPQQDHLQLRQQNGRHLNDGVLGSSQDQGPVEGAPSTSSNGHPKHTRHQTVYADETDGPRADEAEGESEDEGRAERAHGSGSGTELVSGAEGDGHSSRRRPSRASSQRNLKPKYKVAFEELVFHETIGKGSYKTVYRGRWANTNVAIVRMRKGGAVTEARMMQQLSGHPNLVQFYRWAADASGNEYVVMELVPLGSLDKMLAQFGPFLRTSAKFQMCEQIASAMAALAREGVLHRDLAVRNVLVASIDLVHVKVADFGLARETYATSQRALLESLPVRWTPPEVVLRQEWSPASDVWAFGVTMWEIFSNGCEPYASLTNEQVVRALLSGTRLERPAKCPREVFALMAACWATDPRDRPSFDAIIERFGRLRDAARGAGVQPASGVSEDGSAQTQSSAGSAASAVAAAATAAVAAARPPSIPRGQPGAPGAAPPAAGGGERAAAGGAAATAAAAMGGGTVHSAPSALLDPAPTTAAAPAATGLADAAGADGGDAVALLQPGATEAALVTPLPPASDEGRYARRQAGRGSGNVGGGGGGSAPLAWKSINEAMAQMVATPPPPGTAAHHAPAVPADLIAQFAAQTSPGPAGGMQGGVATAMGQLASAGEHSAGGGRDDGSSAERQPSTAAALPQGSPRGAAWRSRNRGSDGGSGRGSQEGAADGGPALLEPVVVAADLSEHGDAPPGSGPGGAGGAGADPLGWAAPSLDEAVTSGGAGTSVTISASGIRAAGGAGQEWDRDGRGPSHTQVDLGSSQSRFELAPLQRHGQGKGPHARQFEFTPAQRLVGLHDASRPANATAAATSGTAAADAVGGPAQRLWQPTAAKDGEQQPQQQQHSHYCNDQQQQCGSEQDEGVESSDGEGSEAAPEGGSKNRPWEGAAAAPLDRGGREVEAEGVGVDGDASSDDSDYEEDEEAAAVRGAEGGDTVDASAPSCSYPAARRGGAAALAADAARGGPPAAGLGRARALQLQQLHAQLQAQQQRAAAAGGGQAARPPAGLALGPYGLLGGLDEAEETAAHLTFTQEQIIDPREHSFSMSTLSTMESFDAVSMAHRGVEPTTMGAFALPWRGPSPAASLMQSPIATPAASRDASYTTVSREPSDTPAPSPAASRLSLHTAASGSPARPGGVPGGGGAAGGAATMGSNGGSPAQKQRWEQRWGLQWQVEQEHEGSPPARSPGALAPVLEQGHAPRHALGGDEAASPRPGRQHAGVSVPPSPGRAAGAASVAAPTAAQQHPGLVPAGSAADAGSRSQLPADASRVLRSGGGMSSPYANIQDIMFNAAAHVGHGQPQNIAPHLPRWRSENGGPRPGSATAAAGAAAAAAGAGAAVDDVPRAAAGVAGPRELPPRATSC